MTTEEWQKPYGEFCPLMRVTWEPSCLHFIAEPPTFLVPLAQSDQPLPQFDHPTLPAQARAISTELVLPQEYAMPDDDKDRLANELRELNRLTATLREFAEQDKDDRSKGFTRQRSDGLLQSILTEQQKLRVDMQTMKGELDNQLTSHRVRLEHVEVGVAKLEKRIDAHDEKLGDLKEDTGSYQLENLKDYKKRSEKLTALLIAAGATIVVTVISAWVIAQAQIDKAAAPRPSDPKELIGK